MVSSPEDRSGVIKALAEGVGGQIISFDYCFGEFDFVGAFEFPDNTTMASLVMAVGSTGSVTNLRTIVDSCRRWVRRRSEGQRDDLQAARAVENP